MFINDMTNMFQQEKLQDKCFVIPCINVSYVKINIFGQLCVYLHRS